MPASDNYEVEFGDDRESLAIFLGGLRKFNENFSKLMPSGNDFTLRLEVHANKGKLLHCRVYEEEIARPNGKRKNS